MACKLEINTKRLENAVLRVCQELISSGFSPKDWQDCSEENLFNELASCLLGSRVPFEIATGATSHLFSFGYLRPDCVLNSPDEFENSISVSLSEYRVSSEGHYFGRKYPFPRIRANYLRRSAEALYCNGRSLKQILSNCLDAHDARRNLVNLLTGIGPKQASLFLRNIGYSDDLAILDSHVMSYLEYKGLLSENRIKVNSLPGYEKVERVFCDHAHCLGFSVAQFDLAVWVVMRVAKREIVT